LAERKTLGKKRGGSRLYCSPCFFFRVVEAAAATDGLKEAGRPVEAARSPSPKGGRREASTILL